MLKGKRALARAARLARLAALDAVDVLTGSRPPLTPSRLANDSIGGFDFHRVGNELASLARTLVHLQPNERVLDAGCGYGRLAVPLTGFLAAGEYSGFDIDAAAIRWCRREISARHSNFWFNHVDVANSYYNPRGAVAPETFTFPCADASVDVVVATSLFTHLLPPAATRYVSEIARVLKPDGRAMLTFFLFDEISRQRIGNPPTMPLFRHFPAPFHAVSDPAAPELAVAYDVDVVTRVFGDLGLTVEKVARGGWSLNPDPATYQDVIVARRRSGT